MAINFNSNNITQVNWNGNSLTQVNFNGVKVWPAVTPVEPNYFYIECLTEMDPNTKPHIYLSQGDGTYYPTLYYSNDKTNWSLLSNETIIEMEESEKIYFKAGPLGNVGINQDEASEYNGFSLNYGTFSCGGDISTLQNENGNVDPYTVGTSFQFARIFQAQSNLVSCSNLILPTKIYDTYLHYGFYQSGIQDFPDFSHITHIDYNSLGSCFRATPATGAVDFSSVLLYDNTSGNTNQYGFNHCFRQSGVTSAKFSSAIPSYGVFNSAFLDCSNLSSIEVGWTSWGGEGSAAGTYNSWVNRVSSTGTFKCPTALGTNETIERGTVRCPANWTVINTD